MRRLVLALALAAAAPLFACQGDAAIAQQAEAWPADLAKPTSVDEAQALRAQGVTWSNRQVRQLYLERVATIAGDDATARAAGASAEERARRAFTTRHEARRVARAMMSDADEVRALQARDREKYGSPDGPGFAYLVDKARADGQSGDAVYESIVASAERTDASTNKSLGL